LTSSKADFIKNLEYCLLLNVKHTVIMKKLIALAVCFLAFGSSFAQQGAAPKRTSNANRTVISGTILDARNHPIEGVQTFVYPPDSSIIASAYTDATGYYETNSVLPGTYSLKIVYPSNKAIMVTGVVIKRGMTRVNIKANPPDADTVITYKDLMLKPVEKSKTATTTATKTTTTVTTTSNAVKKK
jgi:hypothetical protein